MNEKKISIGTFVTYPKTGTTGKVISVDEINGRTFFQVDKTGLFYREDLLMPALSVKERHKTEEEDIRKKIEDERRLTSEDMREAIDDVDGVGAG